MIFFASRPIFHVFFGPEMSHHDFTGFDWIRLDSNPVNPVESSRIHSNPVESTRIQSSPVESSENSKLKTSRISGLPQSTKLDIFFVIWFQNYTPIFGHWSRPEVLSQFFQIWIIAIIRDRARYARFNESNWKSCPLSRGHSLTRLYNYKEGVNLEMLELVQIFFRKHRNYSLFDTATKKQFRIRKPSSFSCRIVIDIGSLLA